jgi:hypothetical protein
MNTVLSFLGMTAFVWLPVILFVIGFKLYKEFKRQDYRLNKLSFSKYTMLEINIPKEIHKSPQAMEFVIDVMHHLGGGAMDWKHRLWFGAILYPSSLEIVSIEGSIYFFIRTHVKLASLVKSTLYSQFPQVEISEVDDYTSYVPDYTKNQDRWSLYGADFKLSGPNYLPIKTYIDYGLDQSIGKLEEFQKVDPLTPMIEFLSSLGPGEQIWIQYIIRGDTESSWRKEAQMFIEEKMMKKKIPMKGEEDNQFQEFELSPGEKDQVESVQRSLSKHAFETKIRGIYLARKENENPGIVGYFKNPIFKPFSSQFHNGIRKNDDTGFDWVWEDLSGKRDPAKKRRFFKDYVNREAFYRPVWDSFNRLWFKDGDSMILTSEELATLFHLPSTVSETPSLERIDAVKVQPPQNLPI